MARLLKLTLREDGSAEVVFPDGSRARFPGEWVSCFRTLGKDLAVFLREHLEVAERLAAYKKAYSEEGAVGVAEGAWILVGCLVGRYAYELGRMGGEERAFVRSVVRRTRVSVVGGVRGGSRVRVLLTDGTVVEFPEVYEVCSRRIWGSGVEEVLDRLGDFLGARKGFRLARYFLSGMKGGLEDDSRDYEGMLTCLLETCILLGGREV